MPVLSTTGRRSVCAPRTGERATTASSGSPQGRAGGYPIPPLAMRAHDGAIGSKSKGDDTDELFTTHHPRTGSSDSQRGEGLGGAQPPVGIRPVPRGSIARRTVRRLAVQAGRPIRQRASEGSVELQHLFPDLRHRLRVADHPADRAPSPSSCIRDLVRPGDRGSREGFGRRALSVPDDDPLHQLAPFTA